MAEVFNQGRGNEGFQDFKAPVLSSKKEKSRRIVEESPWEPILSDPTSEQNFIVTYSGPYAQRMELNRRNAEKFIDTSSLTCKIFVTDLRQDRTQSISDVNSDGSTTLKRSALWDLSIIGSGDKEREYRKLVEVPDGWRLEIGGDAIRDSLLDNASKKPLEERFAARFNGELRNGLRDILVQEKFRSDILGYWRLFLSAWPLIISGGDATGLNGPVLGYKGDIEFVFSVWLLLNLAGRFIGKTGQAGNVGRDSLKSAYEYVLPPIEIDRYARGEIFTKHAGRNLIRLQENSDLR